jgi:hypothetical protein
MTTKKTIIYCQKCGEPREVSTFNWRVVKLCMGCTKDQRRRANTIYARRRRELLKQQKDSDNKK